MNQKEIKIKKFRLLILIGIILTFFALFVLYNSLPLILGERIILDTTQYDPFDPLRGQYMRIAYEIGTIDNNDLLLERNEKICVLLEEDEQGIYRLKNYSRKKYDSGTYICGIVTSSTRDRINVEYDIERYYFQRSSTLPTQNITVEVAVFNGQSRIIQLLQNGEPIEIEKEDINWRT